MEGNKTTARRARRTASSRPAPVATKKEPAKTRAAKPKAKSPARAATAVVPDRLRMVEIAAYFRAERRGFEPGRELEDWIAAEAEVEAQLAPAPVNKPARRVRKTPAD